MSSEHHSTELILKHNPRATPDYKGHPSDQLEREFERLRGSHYIAMWRRLDETGQLDIHATAVAAGGFVSYFADTGRHLLGGLRHDPEQLPQFNFRLMIGMSPEQERFVFSHELGHLATIDFFEYASPERYAAFHIRQQYDRNQQQLEAQCDYFAMRTLGFDGTSIDIDWNSLPDLRYT